MARERQATAWREQTARRVCEILGFPYENVFSEEGALQRDFVRVRALIYAIAYAFDESKKPPEIARSFGIDPHTILSGVRRIDGMLRVEKLNDDGWRDNIAKVCGEFGIPVERLVLKSKR